MKKYLSILLIAGLLSSCAQQQTVTGGGASDKPLTYTVIDAPDAGFWEGGYAYAVNAYAPSQRNIDALRKLQSDGKALGLFVVAPFKKTFTCRKVYTIQAGEPVKQSFSYLLQSAINDELEQSGLVASKRLRTRIRIDEFDFSTLKMNGWVIRATLKRKGRKPLTVTYTRAIPFAFTASSACNNAVVELNAAIQDFLYTLYTHPRFIEFAQYPLYTSRSSQGAASSTRFIRRKRSTP